MVEVAEIQGQLADLFTSVLDGVIDPRTGAVLAQIANARARVVETALKAREQAELEERLQELETLLATRDEGGSRSWG
jgi:acyl-CoA reductase-like NAD-dependent aldehyde dehydrogenase